MFEDDDSVFAAMRAGARGYLLKGAGPGRDRAGDPRGRQRRGDLRARRRPPRDGLLHDAAARAAPRQAFPELTEREREVLELIAQGLTNAEIARHFVLSPKTVRNHVSNIFTKLQVADRARGDRAGARGGARPGRHALMEEPARRGRATAPTGSRRRRRPGRDQRVLHALQPPPARLTGRS